MEFVYDGMYAVITVIHRNVSVSYAFIKYIA